jgi:hypothetical protein
MYDLKAFSFANMLDASAELRNIANGASSMEAAAQRVAAYFHENFVNTATGRSAFVLSRCFKTHAFGLLPEELQSFARSVFSDHEPMFDTRCLTLLGTAGDRPEWKSRYQSTGHKAIPLISENVIQSLPMVSQLTKSLGLEAHALVNPDPKILLEHEKEGFNVFYVDEAFGSPYVPAQDWVRSFAVKSVIGLGFVIHPSDIIALILFSGVPVEFETAQLFKSLALSLKLAFLSLSSRPVFD